MGSTHDTDTTPKSEGRRRGHSDLARDIRTAIRPRNKSVTRNKMCAGNNAKQPLGPPSWRRLLGDDRGIAMALVTLLGGFMVLTAMLVAARTMAENRAVGQDRSWEQAIHVTETGVDQLLFDLDQSNSVNVAPAGTPLNTKAEVVAAAAAFSAAVTPGGEVVTFTNGAGDKAFAVGYTPDRATANAKARVVEVEVSFSSSGGVFSFPNGALAAGGDIWMTGNAGTYTDPSTEHQASVHANGNFNGTGNHNVDGDITAVGTVIGGNAYGVKMGGVPPMPFPTQQQIDDWQADLLAEAMTGPTLTSLSGTVIAPAYVSGNFKLKGNNTVTLQGPGVIYVDGNLELSGNSQMTNNGVILATAGTYKISGNSTYEVTSPETAGLVSFSTSTEALTLTGNGSAATQGFAYAPNGGAKITGNGAFYGSVVAGNDMTITGNGGVIYPADLNTNLTIGPPTPGGVTVGAQREL